jgi:CubicO group peptidase (beta-lactamase class C family)
MRFKVVFFLALLMTLTTCAGETGPVPRPVATTDIENITLVSYTDREFGLSGMVPDGWFEALPGIYLAGTPEERPGTVLIQRMEGGATVEQALAGWQELLGLVKAPQPAGTRETASFVWGLYSYQTEDPELGTRKGEMALAETEDGVYLVLLATTAGEYRLLHDAVFVPAVDALAPAADDAYPYQQYSNWPVVAAIERAGNNVSEAIEFTLDECTRLRVYAVGEGTAERMQDFGYVENVASGQIPWQMYFFETEAAGYFKNRRVDRILTLPPGDYRLHFQTDGAHAFGDWGDRAPGHPFWGIALYEDRSLNSDPAVCWDREETPEDLGWSSTRLEKLKAELEQLDVAALMVVTDGKLVFEWGNTANNFQAHSMRKSLMSALFGIYVAESAIDTSKTLQELGIDDRVPLTEMEREATVADLLKARSGVYIPAAGEADSMKAERPGRGSHKPGTHWYYNNWDFNALGTIFEQETGENIYDAFETRIADAIGMQDFFPERLGYTYEYWLSQHPYYGFRISARDLARFGQLFLQEGTWCGQDSVSFVVPADWVEESTRSHSQTGKSGTYSGYGYMWWIAAKDHRDIMEGSYAASGYGGHTLEVLPDLNTVIVFRVNTDDPDFQPIQDQDWLVLRVLEARNR